MAYQINDSTLTTSSMSKPAKSSFMVTLNVDGQTFAVNKALLMDESPVFNAMFSHDTKEAASNHVEILDFDASTVVAVVACLNDHFPTDATIEEIFKMLALADKYLMETVIAELETVLINILTNDNLVAITRCALKQSRQHVKAACIEFYRTAYDFDFGPRDYDVKEALMMGVARQITRRPY